MNIGNLREFLAKLPSHSDVLIEDASGLWFKIRSLESLYVTGENKNEPAEMMLIINTEEIDIQSAGEEINQQPELN